MNGVEAGPERGAEDESASPETAPTLTQSIREGAKPRHLLDMAFNARGPVPRQDLREASKEARKARRSPQVNQMSERLAAWRDDPRNRYTSSTPPIVLPLRDTLRAEQRSLVVRWNDVQRALAAELPDLPLEPLRERIKVARRYEASRAALYLTTLAALVPTSALVPLATLTALYLRTDIAWWWLFLLIPAGVLSFVLSALLTHFVAPTTPGFAQFIVAQAAPAVAWLIAAYLLGGSEVARNAWEAPLATTRDTLAYIAFVNVLVWTAFWLALFLSGLLTAAIITQFTRRAGRDGISAAANLSSALQILDSEFAFQDARLREEAGSCLVVAAKRIGRDYPDARKHLKRPARRKAKSLVAVAASQLESVAARIAFNGEESRREGRREVAMFLHAILSNDLSTVITTSGETLPPAPSRMLASLRMLIVAALPAGMLYLAQKTGLVTADKTSPWMVAAILWAIYCLLTAIDPTFGKRLSDFMQVFQNMRGPGNDTKK